MILNKDRLVSLHSVSTMNKSEANFYKLGLDGLACQKDILNKITTLLSDTVDELNQLKDKKHENSEAFDLLSKYMLLFREIKRLKTNIEENLVFLKTQLSFFINVSQKLTEFDTEIEEVISKLKYEFDFESQTGTILKKKNSLKHVGDTIDNIHRSLSRIFIGKNLTMKDVDIVKRCRSLDAMTQLYKGLKSNSEQINLMTFQNFLLSFKSERGKIEDILPVLQHNVTNYKDLASRLDNLQATTEKIIRDMHKKEQGCAIL